MRKQLKPQTSNLKTNRGFVLIVLMTFLSLAVLAGVSYLTIVASEANMCRAQVNSTKALFLAEAGLQKAMADIRDNNIITPQTITLADANGALNELESVPITININATGYDSMYEVDVAVTVDGAMRMVHGTIMKDPPSKVFDYSYFINNWGWFYGQGITASGDVRSNGRFDFRDNPRVNGDIYAGGEIDDGGDGIRGTGGNAENQHPNSETLVMPNLQDLSYYRTLAQASGGSITIDGDVVVDQVMGDDQNEPDNIVLVGTPSKPIILNGPVVVEGDVVIKGTVAGQGTIYAGRNVYIADDIDYKNAPSSPRPSGNNPEAVNNWVRANENKDILGLAARENIILGDYTSTSHYGYSGNDRWYAEAWLFDMGGEDVGEDGIPDTNDTGENDGSFDLVHEDLDGDNVFDNDYNWSNVETQAPISSFGNLPSGVTAFSDLATNRVSKIDAICYTNHAFTGRVGYGVQVNGAIISKDEAIIYRNNITMNYDERIHSRYRTNSNWLIDLELPLTSRVQIVRWWEY